VIGIGDIQTQTPRKWTRHDKDPASRSVSCCSLCEHAHALTIAAADEAESIVLDLVGPARAGRNRAAHHWQARLYEAGTEYPLRRLFMARLCDQLHIESA
jgi:hypothetical protein